MGPWLERREVLLARTAGKKVSAALEPELARAVEADRGVRAVHLLFDDQESACDLVERRGLEIFVARPEA